MDSWSVLPVLLRDIFSPVYRDPLQRVTRCDTHGMLSVLCCVGCVVFVPYEKRRAKPSEVCAQIHRLTYLKLLNLKQCTSSL